MGYMVEKVGFATACYLSPPFLTFHPRADIRVYASHKEDRDTIDIVGL
jgi:hypothetical protein